MATVIQIKRSTGSTAPATSDLVNGEMAYAQDASNDGASAKLYMESVDSGGNQVIHTIGGKFYTDELDAATNASTASTIVKRDGSGNFSAGTITADLTGDVTGDISGNVTAGTVSFSTSLSDGTITVTGFVDEDNMASDSATLIPTQQSVKAYVDTTAAAAFDLDFSGDSGTGVIEESETLAITGDTGITTTASGNGLSIDLDDTAVTPGSYGNATSIPTFTVDQQGRITAASTASISSSFDLAADTGTTDTFNNGETLTIAGTANEIATTVSNNQITVGLATNPTISGNLTVSGDMTISGTTTTVNTSTLTVEDPLIALANGNNTTDAVDVGIYGLYDTSGSQDLYSGLFRDASDSGKWKLFKDSQTAPTTTVDTAATGYTVATLVADIEGSITGGTVSGLTAAIAVADGGSGATSFTSNGIVYGNGTGALQATAAGTDGYFLYSNNGTPDWSNTIDGGSY